MLPVCNSLLKVSNLVGGLLVVFFLLIAYDHSLTACPRDIAQTASEFIKLFASGNLSVNAAKKLIEGEASIERHGAYWQVKSKRSLAEIVLHAEGQDESVDEAELRLQLESGLVLSDLEKAFGPWQLVVASKTSSVSFRVVGRAEKPALVFVRLFTPNPLPDSPVLSVQLRREDGMQGPGAR
ncbi:MAG TPA: hypothetical protein VNN62_22935 [Methylomirabilota bacterium]|jgi:hypothetical protein|nr:hypothetical protein [Methylomirabilota bacterium]